jgi:hypothetical protein
VTPVSLGPIVITVSDPDRSVEFYIQALTFRKESEIEARLDSFDRLTGIFGTNVRPVPADSRSNDARFQRLAIVVRDMNVAHARLREHM